MECWRSRSFLDELFVDTELAAGSRWMLILPSENSRTPRPDTFVYELESEAPGNEKVTSSECRCFDSRHLQDK